MALTNEEISALNEAEKKAQGSAEKDAILKPLPIYKVIEVLREHPNESLRIIAFTHLGVYYKESPGVMEALYEAAQNKENSVDFQAGARQFLLSDSPKPKQKDSVPNTNRGNLGFAVKGLLFVSPMIVSIVVNTFDIVENPVLANILSNAHLAYPVIAFVIFVLWVIGSVTSAIQAAQPTATQIGMRFLDSGHYKDAIESFKQATNDNPQDDRAWYLLGLSYDNNQQEDEAMRCYDRAIILNSFQPNAWNNKGRIYYGRGEFSKAKECYEKALEYGSQEAKNNLETMKRFGRSE